MSSFIQKGLEPSTISTKISTAFGIGFIRKAPGTWGSIPGLFLGLLIHYISRNFVSPSEQNDAFRIVEWGAFLVISGLLLIGVLIAIYAIHRTEKLWNVHDAPFIVVDEVIGQAIGVAFFPFEWVTLLLGFICFRTLDILKPGPIGWADRSLPGALGTLLDDVMAGVFTAIVLALARSFY